MGTSDEGRIDIHPRLEFPLMQPNRPGLPRSRWPQRGIVSPMRRLLPSACAAAFLFATAGQGRAATESKITFHSGGVPIQMDCYTPPGASRVPVILIAHGAHGLDREAGGDGYRRVAWTLADRGFLVAVVHYFERTGTKHADAASQVRCLPVWHETLCDGVDAARRLPRADASRVAIAGFSLGGTLAISVAAFEPKVGALVDFFGGLPPVIEGQIKRLPPTLILHGTADQIVSIHAAQRLAALAQRLHVMHELKVYPGAGHGFSGEAGRDSLERTVAFLQRAFPP